VKTILTLSSSDIKKLNYEKRPGFIFSAMFISLGLVINLVVLYAFEKNFSSTIILVDIAIGTLSILIPYFMNKKLNLDLKEREKFTVIANISKKEKYIIHEAGSGNLFIPILGYLFPKIWGQEMRVIHKTSLIINRARYPVDEKLYNMLNDGNQVVMFYAKYSKTLLSIEKYDQYNQI